MTYEFNADDTSVNDFPNPFKIENSFLLLSAAVLMAGGISVLLSARTYLQVHQDRVAVVTVIVAIGLFATAIKFAIQALSQLRFVLGRKFPSGLAEEVPINARGLAKGAIEVMQTLHRRAVEFREPRGPLNGLLYCLIKPLMTSPPPIQAAAARHFHAVLAMTTMLASLLESYVLFHGCAYEGIISWLYLPFTGLSLWMPLTADQEGAPATNEADGDAAILWKLLALIVFAIVAPVVIPRFVPAFGIPPLWMAPLLLLIGSMGASLLFLASLFARLDNVPQTSVSCEQTTVSMNCHPSQLWTQASRDFQDNWVRNTPNRSYANVPPGATDCERGEFQGYILEETQPTATDTLGLNSFWKAIAVKHLRYLASLGVWGLALSCLATGVAVHYAPLFAQMERFNISRILLMVIALGVPSLLSFRNGHLLWSRMYFKSRLIWITVDGTYHTSKLSMGNQFTGHAQSTSTLTRVEDATLRVWVADIVSVAFGKDGKRFIMALAPADGFAKETAERLVQFAQEQSSVAAPTSGRDFAKAQAMGLLDAALPVPSDTGFAALTKDKLAQGWQSGCSEKATGRVKFYDVPKEFGFIAGSNGVDYFFSLNQLNGRIAKTGDRVAFVPVDTARGPQANRVRAMPDEPST